MNQNLTSQDIESIAQRVVEIFGERLAKLAACQQTLSPAENPLTKTPTRLAYSLKELCAELGLCPTTIWSLESRGLLRSVSGVRHKIFSHKEVERFLSFGDNDLPSWRSAKRPRSSG